MAYNIKLVLYTIIILFLRLSNGLNLDHKLIFQNTEIVSDMAEQFADCDMYGKRYPLDDHVTGQCYMEINKGDIDDFIYNLRINDFKINLVNIYLNFSQHANYTSCTITPKHWIWTFPGKNGGYQYIHLMKEFNIYSLGLLGYYTLQMTITINVKGTCPVIIGEGNTTERIGLALLQAFNESLFGERDVELTHGYVCYISRTFIEDKLYSICKYVICPAQTIGYRCCKNTFNQKTRRNVISCDSTTTVINQGLWWSFPIVVGCIMFLFSPVLFLNVMCKTHKDSGYNVYTDNATTGQLWLRANPISIGTILKTASQNTNTSGRFCSSFIKILWTMLSSICVVAEVLAYYFFQSEFVVSSTKTGVPLNWINMAAGYHLSRDIFLSCFGGPYVALALYYISVSILLCVPSDLGVLIDMGLHDEKQFFVSLLTVDLTTKSKFGAILDIQRHKCFTKFYSVLTTNIYMLINPSFWTLGIRLQIRRFFGYLNIITRGRQCYKFFTVIIFLPIYFTFCIVEWILLLLYSLPIIGFFVILIRAYYNSIKHLMSRNGISVILIYCTVIIMTLWVAFDIYIFSLLFIDSFIFLSRVCTYTFTGLIAYPDITYGYFVFAITVTIYITESLQHIHVVYSNIFEKVQMICERLYKKGLFPGVVLLKKDRSRSFVSASLFRYVVRYKQPLRIEIMFSFLKVFFIIIILYMAISIILTFQEMSKMTALTQTVTALFICLIPKLWKMFMYRNKDANEIKDTNELTQIITQYCRIHSHESVIAKPDEDSDFEDLNGQRQEHSDDSTDELLLDIEI